MQSILRRVRASALGLLPQSTWKRALGFRPVRVLRDAIVGSSDSIHLAEGPVRFERLQFEFVAPYQIWVKARERGVENRICRLLMDRCGPGSVCIDVGANCGFISLVMALSAGDAGRVISFEPADAYFDVLQRNIALNGLEEVCVPFQAFVGSKSEPSGKRLSLDDVARNMALTRVDAIKVDVDGEDFDVLRGATELLRRWRPLVIVEMTKNQDAIYEFLGREIGYSSVVGMSGEAVVPGQWPPNLFAADGEIVVPERGSLT